MVNSYLVDDLSLACLGLHSRKAKRRLDAIGLVMPSYRRVPLAMRGVPRSTD
jgi:hypothetical protein